MANHFFFIFFVFASFQISATLCLQIPLHGGWSAAAPDLRHAFSAAAAAASSAASLPPINAFTSPSITFFTPILTSANFSSSKGFALGFYSYLDPPAASSNSSTISTLLSVCLGTNSTDSLGRTFAVPVWSANRQKPLKHAAEGASLALSEGGGGRRLELKDGNGSVVWAVETEGAAAMELKEDGDWVVYGAAGGVMWRSFEHPTDILLQGQALVTGQKLVSNNSLFSMKMLPGGIVFFMNAAAPGPMSYWSLPINAATLQYLYQHTFDLSVNPPLNMTDAFFSYGGCPPSVHGFYQPYAMLSGDNLTVFQSCPHVSAFSQWPRFVNTFRNASYDADYLILDDDGYPKGYTYLYQSGGGGGGVAASGGHHYLFSNQADLSYCLAPNACGPYGICDEFMLGTRHTCRCPSSDSNPAISNNAFLPIDPSDATRGCRRSAPLPDCGAAAGRSHQQSDDVRLIEMKQTTFISIHVVFETTYRKYAASLDECISRCYANCSCSGFFYHRSTSYCLPFSDSASTPEWLPDVTLIHLDNPDFSAYLKMRLPNGAAPNLAAAAAADQAAPVNVKAAVLAIVAVAVAVIAALLVFCLWRYWRTVGRFGMRGGENAADNEDDEDGQESVAGKGSNLAHFSSTALEDGELASIFLPVRYTYRELRKATGEFKRVLGRGGFGIVYEGVLKDGRKVAVKKLYTEGGGGGGGRKQFLAEVAMIGEISHYNIAKLCGFCVEGGKRLLVYEYMENGSLDKWLFGGGGGEDGAAAAAPPLGWRERYRVALGTARGLAYLHEECRRPVIHFDVKPQNILLDAGFVPKLSDFGLAKLLAARNEDGIGVSSRRSAANGAVTITAVRGTPGYLAPEWLCHSVVSKKCDVYSYGMVLLELIGGRRNTISSLVGTEEWYYPAWAVRMAAKGELLEAVDRKLTVAELDMDQVNRVAGVAFLCIQRDPAARPSMSTVCKMLEGTVDLEEIDLAALHQSLDYAAVELDSELSVPATASCILEGR